MTPVVHLHLHSQLALTFWQRAEIYFLALQAAMFVFVAFTLLNITSSFHLPREHTNTAVMWVCYIVLFSPSRVEGGIVEQRVYGGHAQHSQPGDHLLRDRHDTGVRLRVEARVGSAGRVAMVTPRTVKCRVCILLYVIAIACFFFPQT